MTGEDAQFWALVAALVLAGVLNWGIDQYRELKDPTPLLGEEGSEEGWSGRTRTEPNRTGRSGLTDGDDDGAYSDDEGYTVGGVDGTAIVVGMDAAREAEVTEAYELLLRGNAYTIVVAELVRRFRLSPSAAKRRIKTAQTWLQEDGQEIPSTPPAPPVAPPQPRAPQVRRTPAKKRGVLPRVAGAAWDAIGEAIEDVFERPEDDEPDNEQEDDQ